MPRREPNEKGSYGYSIVLVLPATLNSTTQAFKRISEIYDFQLTSIESRSDGNFSIIIGNQRFDFSSTYAAGANVCGNSCFVHKIPAEQVFEKGSSISIKVRNDTASQNSISLKFMGVHQ